MKPAAAQRLRHEQQTFALNHAQAAQWFRLRLTMAYASLVLTIGLGAVLAIVVLSPERFSPAVCAAAAAGLFIDMLGALLAVWKLVLGPGSERPLKPPDRRRRD